MIFGLGELTLFDSVANIIGLLLMTLMYGNYYDVMCKPCHKIIYKFAKRSKEKKTSRSGSNQDHVSNVEVCNV